MRLVRIDPPGSLCTIAAVEDRLRGLAQPSVLEVGCGGGSLLRALCARGCRATGIDPSAQAMAVAAEVLEPWIRTGRCRLLRLALDELFPEIGGFDVGISMMTIEHIPDDVAFVRALSARVRPGGTVLVGVPGRLDRWGVEDEVVGHLRRYERGDLAAVLRAAGLRDVEVWSLAVPAANLLFHVGSRLVRRFTPEATRQLGPREQTATSGIREIPFKTVFPPWFRVLLNPVTLAPLLWMQRRYYDTELGLTLLGSGRTAEPEQG